jgi:glycosyltransferase involved in cell wall biosynthesis
MPYFSIVIPTYNRAGFIVDTVNSVVSQDFADFEVIIVDDGSTDNTEEIISSNFSKNAKIQYFKKENSERGASRNFGFRKSEAKFVVFFDSDDLMHENHLSTLKAAIEQNPTNHFFATKFNFIRDGKIIPNSDLNRLSGGVHNVEFLLLGNGLACNFAVRRNNPELQLFEEDRSFAVMEDWMFLVENISKSPICIIDKITISMNDHDSRSMRVDANTIAEKRIRATKWLEERVGLNKSQKARIWAYTYKFCGIHYYADFQQKDALKYWRKFYNYTGLTKESVALGAEFLLGRKLILMLQKFS